jgi:hypothetical protein
MNLLSVSQLCDKGMIVKFDKEHAIVHKKGKPNEVVLRGYREKGLYVFKMPKAITFEQGNNALTVTKSPSRSELYYRRMGHLNFRLISNLSDGLVLGRIPSTLCVPYTQAKAHRTPFKASQSHAPSLGDLINTDVCYVEISLFGQLYC